MASRDQIQKILQQIPNYPDTAVVPVAVAAAHDHVSERTVRRNYPLKQLSERRHGVTVGYLRHRGQTNPA
jgi:hypothetical protein